MERLTARNEYGEAVHARYYDKDGHFQYSSSKDVLEKLAEYEEAEEQKRLIVLPCSRGNILYRICGDEIIEECVKDIIIQASLGQWSIYNHLNKIVFLTREQAEMALKGGVGNERN